MVGPKHVQNAMVNLAKNFERHVEEYRKNKEHQLVEGKIQDLKKELENIQKYLDLYHSDNGSSVCDTAENINFQLHKVDILRQILSQKKDLN